MSGHFFYRADQLSRMSEPSRENGLKLKPRVYCMATTRNSSQTRKVVSVRFSMRGHIFHAHFTQLLKKTVFIESIGGYILNFQETSCRMEKALKEEAD